MRVGIVGCGKIADGHAEQLRTISRAELVAACDREPLMVEQFAQRWSGIARHTDLERMVRDERLDVVHLATPPDSHVALACAALELGCHVFVEKPFAPDAKGAAQILEAARTTGKRVSVNYLYNFESPALALRELIEAGALGSIVHLDTSLGYNLAGDYGIAVMSDPMHWVHRLPGKLFHNVLDHVLAKLVAHIDDDFTVQVIGLRRREATGSDAIDAMPDELRFMLRSGDGVTATGMVSSHARPVAHSLKVYGSRDTVELDYACRTLVRSARQTQPSSLGRLFPPWVQAARFSGNAIRNLGAFGRYESHYFHCMRVLLEQFYTAIEDNGPDPVAHTEILRVAKMIDAIVAALEPRP